MKNNAKQMNAKQRQRIRQREKAKVLKQVGREMISQTPTARDPRWFAELKDLKLPFGLGASGFRAGSGTVGVAPKALDPQRSTPKLKSARSVDGNVVDVITGTDLIATVSSGVSGNQPGDLLVTQLISPTQFELSRLRQFSALYQRYRFSRIRFIYEPIANATQSGQLVGYADFDPDNALLVDSPANVSIAVAHQGQQITQIWEPVVFDMAQIGTFTDLYTEVGTTSSDPRLSLQGIFYLIAASVLPSNIPLGNVYIDYEVQFSIPFLEQTSETLAFGTSWLGTGSYTSTVGGLGTIANLQPPTTIYSSVGPYAPQFGAGSMYWDQSFTGVPFVKDQVIYANFLLKANAINPGTSGQDNLIAAVLDSTPAGGVSMVGSPLLQPTTVHVVGQSAPYAWCVTAVFTITAPTVSNWSIGLDSTATSTGVFNNGTYMIGLHITQPPLLAQKNLLKAVYLKHKTRRNLIEEIRQVVQQQRQIEVGKGGVRVDSGSLSSSSQLRGDSPKGKSPLDSRNSPTRTPSHLREQSESAESIRARLAELEAYDD